MANMTKIVYVVPLIRRTEVDSFRWLGIWQAEQGFWDVPVFQKLEDESVQTLLKREIAWRLNIDRNEFLVARMSQLHVNPIGDSSNPDQDDEVELIFNSVDVVRAKTIETLSGIPDFRWLTASELCSGQTTDQQRVNPKITRWLNRWQVIQPWQ